VQAIRAHAADRRTTRQSRCVQRRQHPSVTAARNASSHDQ
jgi:hypothetical protein